MENLPSYPSPIAACMHWRLLRGFSETSVAWNCSLVMPGDVSSRFIVANKEVYWRRYVICTWWSCVTRTRLGLEINALGPRGGSRIRLLGALFTHLKDIKLFDRSITRTITHFSRTSQPRCSNNASATAKTPKLLYSPIVNLRTTLPQTACAIAIISGEVSEQPFISCCRSYYRRRLIRCGRR